MHGHESGTRSTSQEGRGQQCDRRAPPARAFGNVDSSTTKKGTGPA
ncbi:hypothetical protein HMPREF0307_00947 [Corynebacterium sp. DNF00584]|nr:hypothetical protein HMPREF0307_00947 [Corynebacterium sp. DNF00584]